MSDSAIRRIIETALWEDLHDVGDLTSQATIDPDAVAHGLFSARMPGVVAGIDIARRVFAEVDETVSFVPYKHDGDRIEPGEPIIEVDGNARSILTAERTALNLMGRMSGVATSTRQLVDAVAGTDVKISDTRKTMPGLRVLDKAAVSAGGGINHRMGLYDAVMIKDNHLVASGGIREAVAAARSLVGHSVMIELEVENLEQLAIALETDVDRVLLDNMEPEILSQAVAMTAGQVVLEASGGITLETVRSVAETGVDIISVGWITHSPPQLDIGLDFHG